MSKKKILLGVCGSIAAYKIAELVRLLVQDNMEVRVIMTRAAKDFVTPATLSTLSQQPVLQSFYKADGTWSNHVALGLWADYLLIAPLTAHTMAKMAQGMCDNLLLATYLSARCPVVVAPAMDHDMYIHQATQHSVKQLKAHGVHFLPPQEGPLASGIYGQGRMQEPEQIAEAIATMGQEQRFAGKQVLITAGPTYEAIDPVRFIGNFSSGKMGVALALTLARQGAIVSLVLGPTAMTVNHPNIDVYAVRSAEEMYDKALQCHPKADIVIFAAAVSDYKPKQRHTEKIKKNQSSKRIELVENPDIAALLSANKRPGQVHVGFALETHDEVQHAEQKLKDKALDMIVLNSLRDEGAGFQQDTNKVSLFFPQDPPRHFPLAPKLTVAEHITQVLYEHIQTLATSN